MKRTASERFWEKVDTSGDCWLWLGAKTSRGYGHFRFEGRMVKAHRWAYEARVAPIPPGLVIDHLCRVPLCVNPAHLEPVTDQENLLRGEGFNGRQARQTHCLNGHPFDEANTYIRPSDGHRNCRQCHEDRRLARLARARGEEA